MLCSRNNGLQLTLLLLVSALLAQFGSSLKILQGVETYSDSHQLFNFRLAKTLNTSGHNVTLMLFTMAESFVLHTKPPSNLAVLNVPTGFSAMTITHWLSSTYEPSRLIWDILMLYFIIMEDQPLTCGALLDNVEVQDHLARTKDFDVALVPVYYNCPMLAYRSHGINSALWHSCGMYILPNVAISTGLPYPASYVPHAYTTYNDRMTFMERVVNLLAETFYYLLFVSPFGGFAEEQKVVNDRLGNPETSLKSVVQETRGVLLAGEQMLELPRPIMHNYHYLSSIEKSDMKPLAKNFEEDINSSSKGAILFSLGSVANTSQMPQTWKDSLLEAFAAFPEYTIFCKFDAGQFPESKAYKHIKIYTWLQQREILAHPKTKLFITHGGLNSYLELVQTGKPAVVLPLFGDQPGNAVRIQDLGLGIAIDKSELSGQHLIDAMRSILNDQRYASRAKSISMMIGDKIRPSEQLLSHFIHKVSKHNGNYPRVSKIVGNMFLFQYYCIDVLLIFVSLLAIIVVLPIQLMRCLRSCLCERR